MKQLKQGTLILIVFGMMNCSPSLRYLNCLEGTALEKDYTFEMYSPKCLCHFKGELKRENGVATLALLPTLADSSFSFIDTLREIKRPILAHEDVEGRDSTCVRMLKGNFTEVSFSKKKLYLHITNPKHPYTYDLELKR